MCEQLHSMEALPFLSSETSGSFSEVKVGAGIGEDGASVSVSEMKVDAGVGEGEDGRGFLTGHLQGFSSIPGKSS